MSTKMRPAVSHPNKTQLSAPASPEGTLYQWEQWSLVLPELAPLFKRYFAELGPTAEGLELDPDWRRYFEYERSDILKVWTARAPHIIGFVLCLLTRPMHYDALYCFSDTVYLAPEWRKGLRGYRMVKRLLSALEGMNVKAFRFETNAAFDPRVELLLKRLEFAPAGLVLQRMFQ
jgi:hypothetical protein